MQQQIYLRPKRERTYIKQRRAPNVWFRIALFSGGAIVFLSGITIAWAFVAPMPSINDFENRDVAQSTKIYDRTGNIVLYDVHGNMRRTAVSLGKMSSYVKNATIAIEDATFYSNAGFRPLSFLRAVFVDVTTGGYAQGASTITQQVVKNALLTKDKTISRKLEEIVLALRLTQMYSKDEILQTYLNEIPYGGTIYGVQEASQYFFGVDAKDLDLAQSAYLAAMTQAPTHYSPYGSHKDELESRKNLVLKRMLVNKFITQKEYDAAAKEKVSFRNEQTEGIKAPHFVFFIRDYLEQKYGADVVESGGLKVVTTLDYDLQQKAEDVVSRYAVQNQKNFNASNAGMVAIDPKTGQILVMVGSRNYFDASVDGAVNVTTSPRQPGSAFKPFIYATAFEKGYTPDTVVFDVQTQFSTACAVTDVANDTPPCYSPSNYDGKFAGPISLRDAIAQSKNIPSVKVLYLAGITDSLKTAQDMGITTLTGDKNQYGLTLVLGGGEVYLLDMTSAYSVFANDGVKNPPVGILHIEDKNGKVLEEYKANPTPVMDPQIARKVTDILSDNVARTPEFGADSPLNFPDYKVADKTGTTNDFKDVWVLGYTPSIAAGAWAGNNDATPMEKNIAAFIVAPMWHEFFAYAMTKYPADPFPASAPDPAYNTLPPILRGVWKGYPDGVHEILNRVDKDNPRTGTAHPWSDPQAAYWDYPVQLWLRGQGATTSAIPTAPGTAAVSAATPETPFKITSPQSGTSISSLQHTDASASVPNPSKVKDVVFYLNGAIIGTVSHAPYTVSFWPGDSRGPAQLRAVEELTNGSTAEQTINFSIQ